MSEEPEDPQGKSGGLVPTPPRDDDDPTLETEVLVPDDEPTLETEAKAPAGDSTSEVEAPKTSGWGWRLEQMTVAKKQRRRHVVTRFWLAAVPVFVLVVAGSILLAVYGGQGGGESAVSTTTTIARQPAVGSGLLLVVNDEALTWALILQPWDSGGVVLAVPGNTLLQDKDAFKTLADMYEGGGRDIVKAVLGEALDLPIGPVVVAQQSDLPAGLTEAGTGALSGEAVAQAVRTLVGEYSSSGSSDPWDRIQLQGETSGFLRALELDAVSMAATVWTAGALGGTVFAGEGSGYLEPDIPTAKALLAIAVEAAALAVEIKDGAGIEGAARRAGSLLESGGFALLPMGYAAAYPGVENTQIMVAPDSVAKARQVQTLLGLGEIVEDQLLSSDRIIVILGKDFAAGSAK